MNLSDSWISQLIPTTALPSTITASKKALRWLQMTSGLFDTGFTDLKADANRSVTSITESDLASDMLSSIGNADDLLDDLPSHMELDSSFNEVFTDLSDFIKEEGLENIQLDGATLVPENSQIEIEVNVDVDINISKNTRKRKADFTDAVVDHSGYATKKTCVEPKVVIIETPIAPVTNTPLSKQEKYKERRQKNNKASKISRETRKHKFGEMEYKARQLETENNELRAKVTELERLTKQMKDILVQRLSQR